MDKNKNIDRTNLTQDQVAQLDQYDASQKQLHALEDVSATVEQLVITLEQGQTKEEGNTEKLGALLTDMRTHLASLASKETPQTPDYAKPVVDALSKLEGALAASLKGINVQPQVNLPETQVTVAPPDFSGVEKILKNEVPKAFQSAIKAIPKTEIPIADYTPLLESLSGLSEQLLSIENATRMKPLPGNMGILVNGKSVSTANPLPTDATFSGTVTTAPTFKDDPTDTGETAKFGKTNSTTHKQQVEADVAGTITSLPLPAGAATSAKQLPDNHNVVVTSAPTTAVTGPLTDTQLRATSVPISGTVTSNVGTTGGLALDATLTNATQKTKLVDSAGTNVASVDANGALAIQSGGTTGSAVPARAVQVGGTDGTNLRAIKVSAAGVVSVDGSAVTQPVSGPLTDTQLRATPVPVSGTVTATPTGTQDVNQKQVNGVTINVGTGTASTGTQRVAVSSDSFPATQAVTGTFFQATQPVSLATNTPTLQSGSTTTVTQGTGANLHTVVDSGTITAVTGITNALPTGTNVIGKIGIDQTTPGTTNRVDIADSLNNSISAFPATFMRVTDEPHQLFYDAFDTALDTTNRWTSTQGSAGAAAANSAGTMSLGTGTTANGYSKLTSQPSFTLPIPAWLGVSDAIALPDGAAPIANSYRYWGTGTTPGTPSVATPVTDGYGFELNTDGKLRAVVYAAGTRTVIADLSSSGTGTQPLDASYHRYIIYIRTDKAYWYIDGITSAQLVATSNFQSSAVQSLPRLILAIGNSTPPVSNVQIQCTGATAWDTGKNNTQLSDGTLPWRKASISSSGGLRTEKRMATTGTTSTVAGSVSAVTLLSANANRISADIANDSTALLYIKKGSSASTTDFTYLLNPATVTAAGGLAIIDDYNGILTGVWVSATGNARITENI